MNRVFREDNQSLVPGQRVVHVDITTTTSGAISGTTATGYGIKATKTATKTGRYTLQLINADGTATTALGLVNVIATIVGPDDAALTTTKGLNYVLRDNDIASDGTIELQFVQTNAGNADTEVQDGASVLVTVILRDRTGPTG